VCNIYMLYTSIYSTPPSLHGRNVTRDTATRSLLLIHWRCIMATFVIKLAEQEWYDEPRGPLSEDEEHEAWREVDEEGSLHQQAVKEGYED